MTGRFQGFGEHISLTHNYILSFWPELTRKDNPGEENRITLPYPYVIPNQDLFPYLFYWDSYFTIEGLSVDGLEQLVRNTVENFLWEMETYGYVLNYSHPRALTRSQPPYLDRIVLEVMKWGADEEWIRRAYELLRREYDDVWLGRHSTPTGLAHYCDWGAPDDETRAQFESGWDFSTRWGERCRFINAVDLNCNLYSYEKHLALLARFLGLTDEAAGWERKAAHRRELIHRYLYDEVRGLFFDYDYQAGQLLTDRPSLALYHPLFVGIADGKQALRAAKALSDFEQPHGLSCTVRSYPVPEGEKRQAYQWDYPNGWAPLHWVAVKGLKRYGFHEDAARVAFKWLNLCANVYRQTGFMWEKYDVVEGSHEAVSAPHYPTQKGFGWTNGVFSALLGKVIVGLDKEPFGGCFVLEPLVAMELSGRELGANLPNYYGHRLEVRLRLDLPRKKVILYLSAEPPINLKLILKEAHQGRECTISSDAPISTRKRLSRPYPRLLAEWEDVERLEVQVR